MQAVEVAGEQQAWRDVPSSVSAVGSVWWGATILAFGSRIPSLEVARICIEANRGAPLVIEQEIACFACSELQRGACRLLK
jgi:hypothetical protein